ncbi:MAG TPA: acyl-CoA dehydrogenase [Acidimicrobiales bacterium]|jgi:acyl-CoA dehydrogenase|nr:acyl-CoA dehydrogenase [Acidimicrobiales bacterium]
MSTVPSPDEAVAALESFLTDVVDPLEAENADFLADPRARFDERGICSPRLLELRRRVRTAASDAGLYALFVPQALGGDGAGAACQFGLYRHLYARSGPDRPLPYEAVATFTSGPGASLVGLRERVVTGVWRRVLSGELVLAFAMSEPVAPSSGAPMATTAKRAGGGWTISGRKQWVSGGGYADLAVVYASTADEAPAGSDGVSAFLVPLDDPGIAIEPPTLILGRIGGEEVSLTLDGVTVPDDHVLGDLHFGRLLAREGGAGRAVHAAGRAVGLGEWALHAATSYARDAVIFGRVLADDALVQGELAKVAAELAAARLAGSGLAAAIDDGTATATELARTSSFVAEVWGNAYDRAMCVVGGDALRSDARFFDGWHQSMIVRAAEGTTGPMLLGVGKALLAGQ